jgi:hypothetical protein
VFVVGGVKLFFGPAAKGQGAVWGPLRQIRHLCGLTLESGVEKDFGGPAERVKPKQTARRRDHVRLATVAGKPVDAPGHAARSVEEASLAASSSAKSASARASRLTPTSEVPLARSASRFVSAKSRFESQTRETPAARQ